MKDLPDGAFVLKMREDNEHDPNHFLTDKKYMAGILGGSSYMCVGDTYLDDTVWHAVWADTSEEALKLLKAELKKHDQERKG